MKNEDKLLQELLGEKMQQATAPVDPAIWQGIQSALPAAGAGAAVASGFKLGAFGWAAIATAIIGISTAVVVFNQDETPPKEQTVTIQPEISTPEKTQEVPSLEDNKNDLPEEVSTTTTSRVEKVVNTDPVADTIEWEATSVQTDRAFEELPDDFTNVEEEAPVQVAENKGSQENLEEEPSSSPVQNPALSAEFTIAEDPFEDFVITFTPSFKQGASYFWIFGDGTTSYETNPIHHYKNEGAYDVLLNVTDENGFSKTDEMSVIVRKPALLVLPNAFTPNGDGYNDFLNPAERSQNVEILSMQVFSLDGTLLFEQIGEGTGWDGNVFGGEQAKQGDYILIVSGKTQLGENIHKQRKVFLKRN